MAFGDSLTYGTGSERGGGYVSFLSEELHVPIENMGIPGETSLDGLKRLGQVMARKPDVVIVLFGGNDYLQKIPTVETAKNLALIKAALTQAGSRVLLLNLEVLTDVWGKPNLMSDALHPNDDGYKLMAERIAPSVEALFTP